MKKLFTTVLVLFLAHQSFAQLTYFNRTGKGFAIGGTYSHESETGYSINSYGGEVSIRFSKVLSFSLDYMKTTAKLDYYDYKTSGSALIPSITLQIPHDQWLGMAFHAGYADAKLVGGNPTLLLGLELYKRINSEGILQLVPRASYSQAVVLKNAIYDPKPVYGLGLYMAIRISQRAFFVAGPSMSFSDGHSNLSWQVGVVTQ